MPRGCEMPDCPKLHYARGFCSTHWHRWNRYGDPSVTKMPTKGLPEAARFWAHVDSSRGNDACWPWTGRLDGGYGRFGGDSTKVGAHRYAFLMSGGILTEDAPLVLHSCDNRRCCNPAHLRAGTHQDNAHDALERGRHTNAGRVFCIYGHPFFGPNLYLTSAGYRQCRACKDRRAKERGAKKRSA